MLHRKGDSYAQSFGGDAGGLHDSMRDAGSGVC